MFTGIVQALGVIKEIKQINNDCRLQIATPDKFLVDSELGDSICVQGVCLTVVAINKNSFSVDVSNETLQCTTLGAKNENEEVNLEQALTLATKLGGHLVSGHVDGVGKVSEISADGESVKIVVQSPKELARYIARKGSICMDGISLTVNEVNASEFAVNIIPHTLQNTTIKNCAVDARINLEVDLLARYIERMQNFSA